MPRSRSSQRQKNLQAALIAARGAAALSQTELALRLRQPQSFVSKYESGERRLDIVEFIEVCEAIGCNAAAIVEALIRPRETG